MIIGNTFSRIKGKEHNSNDFRIKEDGRDPRIFFIFLSLFSLAGENRESRREKKKETKFFI